MDFMLVVRGQPQVPVISLIRWMFMCELVSQRLMNFRMLLLSDDITNGVVFKPLVVAEECICHTSWPEWN